VGGASAQHRETLASGTRAESRWAVFLRVGAHQAVRLEREDPHFAGLRGDGSPDRGGHSQYVGRLKFRGGRPRSKVCAAAPTGTTTTF
jgi:hypothetical protein